MEAEKYRAFVEEVFIRPMRSVLIIDDDYPTLEDMLACRGEEDGKKWRKEPEAVRNVIDGFHTTNPPFVVDVHDGSNVDAREDREVAAHLHQSDLLVLDYQLTKGSEDGDLSLGILRRILQNEQFNLVILHTLANLKEKVFPAVIRQILPPADEFISADEYEEVQTQFIARQIEDGDGEVYTTLEKSISLGHYLYFRKNQCAWPLEKTEERPDYSAVNKAAAALGLGSDEGRSAVARYALRRWEEDHLSAPPAAAQGHFEWSDKDPMWIRCESGFIAFTNKDPKGQLLDDLTEALVAWHPPPSRLFLAKLRAELDKAGVLAEGKALGNRKVLAHWYKSLLKGSGTTRDMTITATVARHTDMLMDDILPQVRDFASRIVAAEDPDADPAALCRDYFGVDLGVPAIRKAALNEHNAFVCSKEPDTPHLVTGQIFKGMGDYWICLTPICDLVPSQPRLRIGDSQPFIAAKLKKIDGSGVPKNIMEGATVVLKLEGQGPTGYSIAAESNSQPLWRTFYAPDKGSIKDEAIVLYYLDNDAETKLPVLKTETFARVGQLRYEYALSLMHRLGSSMTRVGLDFEEK